MQDRHRSLSVLLLLVISPHVIFAGRAPLSRKGAMSQEHTTSTTPHLPPAPSTSFKESDALQVDRYTSSFDIRKAIINEDLAKIHISKGLRGKTIYSKLSDIFAKYPVQGGHLLKLVKDYLRTQEVDESVIKDFTRVYTSERLKRYADEKKARLAQEGLNSGHSDVTFSNQVRNEEFVKYLKDEGFNYKKMTPDEFFQHWLKKVKDGNFPYTSQQFGKRFAKLMEKQKVPNEWQVRYRKLRKYYKDSVQLADHMTRKRKKRAARRKAATRGPIDSQPQPNALAGIHSGTQEASLRDRVSLTSQRPKRQRYVSVDSPPLNRQKVLNDNDKAGPSVPADLGLEKTEDRDSHHHLFSQAKSGKEQRGATSRGKSDSLLDTSQSSKAMARVVMKEPRISVVTFPTARHSKAESSRSGLQRMRDWDDDFDSPVREAKKIKERSSTSSLAKSHIQPELVGNKSDKVRSLIKLSAAVSSSGPSTMTLIKKQKDSVVASTTHHMNSANLGKTAEPSQPRYKTLRDWDDDAE